MLQALVNVFKIPELRNKILFTIAMLAVFRLGHWIPLPGINNAALAAAAGGMGEERGAFGAAADFIAMMSGGALSHSTLFGLGVMPYITAGIIFQLLTSVMPQFKKLQEEGPTGRQKIAEWTRYATIALCFIQGFGWLQFLNRGGPTGPLIYAEYAANPVWWVMAMLALTAGCMFLMWIGEQIDKYGIGNGVSMIIMAGILCNMPVAMTWVYNNAFGPNPSVTLLSVVFLLGSFVLVVAGSVLLTVAQRRIPVQQAKHTRGRKVFGGQRSYLPLRLNHSGVMPVIFASSLMIFPNVIFSQLYASAQQSGAPGWWTVITQQLHDAFQMGNFPYVVCEVLMIYFFSYFWITVQFNPEEMAKQLREHGSFIPGLRPGPRTAEYLEAVMERITFVGAAMLAVLATLPMLLTNALNVPASVTQFLGGTGMLIVVSVVLDFIQRVEANLLMRNYAGFLGAEGTKGPRIQSARSM